MNYALIGCGRIAQNHIKAALQSKLNIVALCDIAPTKVDKIVKQYELTGVKQYTDYKQMILECEPRLVAIATDSGCHAEIALYCIETGVNVIIEKPMAMNIFDADIIISKSTEKNVKVTVCHQNRFNLSVQQMRNAVEAGRFGKISHGSVHIRWNRSKDYYDQALWRGKWLSDGGALMNQCIHGIDLLRWMMMDEITEVVGFTRQRFHNYMQAEDLGVALVKFKNGSVATIEGTVNVYENNLEETLYLFGENGTIKLGGCSTNTIDVWNFYDELPIDGENKMLNEKVENIYGNGHNVLYQDMKDAIENDRQPYITAQEGKNALELVIAIYKSQKTSSIVKLPLSDFGSNDMVGARLR